MSEEMLEAVRGWLEKSGRAFELRVARDFRLQGAESVRQSYVYADEKTQIQREGDVLAHFHWTGLNQIPCSIAAVVECKSGRDHPWVAFYDRTFAGGSQLSDWVTFAHGPFNGITEPLADLWIGHEPFDASQVATHIAAVHTKDSVHPANDALRQTLSAAAAHRAEYIRTQNDPKRGLVVLPVIVTAAPLVECRLGRDDQVELEHVDAVTVWGTSNEGNRRRVYIVSEGRVPQFAGALAGLARRAGEEARFSASR